MLFKLVLWLGCRVLGLSVMRDDGLTWWYDSGAYACGVAYDLDVLEYTARGLGFLDAGKIASISDLREVR